MKRQLFILFMALFAVNLTAQNILTSPFTLGFLGDASGNNSATNCVYIQNVGVSKVQFIQDSPQQIYVSQGNDIPGEVKLTDATGVDYLIPGFIKWRAPSGNNPSTMIFKPNTGVNLDVVIYNNGQNQVYNISPAKYIGLTFSGSTLNIVNGQVSGNSASMLTILNNYVSSLAKLTVSDVTVAEEDGSASVTILRSGSLNETVSVDYLFSNGTAINGSDFTGISGTANLAIGVTSSVISVPIIDNSVFELTETFTISLNNPQNSSLNGGTAVITILDSDSMVFGCMDTTACNFNPCVFQDNGSCIYPTAELCNGIDDDCDAVIDNGFPLNTFYVDQDADGYGDSNLPILACQEGPGMSAVGGDCDDSNFNLNPGVTEICNNVDDDCDGTIDNGFDLDSDSWTTCEGDCNDADPSINPGVLEGPFQDGSCDFIDNNCDGVVDEYWDQDQDTYTVCEGDCDDFNDQIHPGVVELCNNIDDNCNSQIDENLTQYPVYTDADGDGYGVDTGTTSCTPSTITPGDCDDNNAAINPAAVELCNNIDDNCNDEIDENLEQYPVYTDADGDGYGVDTGTTSCTPSTITPGDCDDNNAAINPNAAEVCGDDVDENCDGQVNEGCVPGCTDATACNFDEAATYDDGSCTYATAEICNNIDDDCDGLIDNGVLNTYYVDAEGDGYGDINALAVEACTAPQGTVDNNTDCDDSNALVNPAQTEVCNDVDDNCNGQIDEGLTFVDYFTDSDLDGYGTTPVLNYCLNPGLGYTTTSGDCDDLNPAINPGEVEVCNNIDDNCNDEIDENLTQYPVYTDADGDGYGVDTGTTSCTPSTITPGDCDDNNVAINPNAAEVCGDDIDENCDGQVNEGCVPGCTDATACNFDEAATYDDGSCTYATSEICNNIDDDCDGVIDNGVLNTYYVDADGDGYGDINDGGIEACTAPQGTVDNNTDCDDSNNAINPAATEVCNDVDDNCDNIIDEGVKTMYYTDADGDGYGDINALAVEACTAPQGTVDNNTDCDDSNALVNPAQTEVCNDVDDNCNGQIDEGLTFVDYFTDSDLDGYGTTPVLNYCLNPGLGYTTISGDCDDLNPAINPGEVEVCNNIDDNCNSQIDENLTQYPVYTDADGDGYGVDTGTTSCTPSTITPGDCDDSNNAINPNAAEVCGDDIDENCDGQVNEGCVPGCTDDTACNFDEAATYDDGSCTYATAEICNNIDDDCDGVIDNGVLNTYYVDADGDGYGDINDGGIEACTAPQGTVDNNTDCDDSNNAINPAQTEVCNDVDDNCDNIIDEGVKTMYYTDADGDGYGDINDGGIEACTAPQGTVDNNTDCDDSNALVNPAQTEVCNDVDDNCNGQIDEGLTFVDYFTDSDLDGYGTTPVLNYCLNPGLGYTTTSGDCDDLNPAINPGEVEVCNNIDDNCNDEIDENLTQYPVYTDADGDGYGVDTGTTSCTPSTITPGDCDDNNAAINPNVAEVCGDDVDENCDGQVNEGCVPGCTDATACNFDEAATYDDGSCTYATSEICNNIDDDCDGVIDNGVLNTYYVDADGDGYGDINDGGIEACTAPQGTVDNNTDCDDSNALVNPAQTEVCNDVDDNCDNIIDEGVKTMYYTDADGDGYGDINALAVEACTAPQGTVDNNTDCDDSNALVNPAQTEVCNDVDDNCNGQIDEGLTFVDYFTDSDLDGYGTTPVLNYCLNPGLGYTTTSGDCDDLNPAINPGEVEVCNNIDDNCNDEIDENLTQYPVYTDADGDGYGVDTGTTSCTPSTITPGDCDDNNAAINPNVAEVCGDDVDENCDGQVNEGCVPGCTDATACNFDEAATYDDGSCTYATSEICNNIDDDCDGVIDNGVLNTYYVDADGDGYGDINALAVEACTAPQGTVDNNTDCDDSNALVNPAQTEVCNDVDDNCNGQIDEGLTFVDYFTDSDLDGYGTTPVLNYCLNPGLGYTTTSGDCDDLNPAINPGEVEVCNNIDDNCNDEIDENLTQYPVYTDADGDGYGVDTGTTSCTPSTITPGDCDDNNAAINPNVAEVCGDDVDENCDGQVNEGCVPGCTDATACNFDEAATYDDGSCTYATSEICNNIDDDCDGVIDNGVLNTYYVDADGDGYGDINALAVEACTAPQGTVDNNTDCDDSNALVNPAQTEVCNDVDDNCNGQIDEGLTFVDYFTDSDLDGYGTTPVLNYCLNPGLGYTTISGDCDDLNPAINPAAVELCNNIDDNCNSQIDENLTQYPVYTDADGDGYGVDTGTTSCTPSTITPGDCDDNNPAINPNAAEVCGDDVDENCDGQVNEGCVPGCTDATACNFDEAATYDDGSCTYATSEICNNIDDDCDGVIDNGVLNTYYVDADGDGYGDINDGGIEACTAPQGTVDNNTDCDDSNNAINPSATEVCNDVDDNCNTEIDENLEQYPVYTDADGDGYGVDTGTTSCTPSTITPGDCDDNNAAINPNAAEVCGDDVDENCDGQVNEGCVPGCTDDTACNFDEAATYDDGSCTYATSEICNNIDDDCDGVIDNGVLNTYYVDADGDGYGDINDGGIEACTAPQGTVDNNTDCDDSNNAINPAAVELCNNIDDNCNDEIDENLTQYPVYTDADGDGYGVDTGTTSCTPSTITPGDCDDNNAAINPNAAEVCGDDVDENCDGQVNEGCVPGCTDATACNFDEAATEDDGSCIYPQPEICNAIDDDCDGIVNNGLSMEALNTVTVNTAYFPACTPTNIFSANPFTGTNTATIDGEGKDRWYKWNAQYNSLRIGLSAAIGDYSIHLFREYPGCLALEMIEHEVTSGNQTLITDELTVGANYYFAVHEHAGPGNTSAKLCINHFLPSDCDHFYSNGTGEYASVCGSFKTLYRGNANNYMINVLSASQAGQNLGIQPWVYQAGSSSVIARLGSILPSNLSSTPVVYTVNVPVMYSIPDAAENYTPVFAQATSTCTITLLPQTPIQVRASDRCPNIKAINSYIAPDQTICGSTAYQWEFTDCTNGVSNPTTQVLTGANGSSIFMLNNIPGIAPGKFYQVRVRPVHGSGVVSAWGTVQCVMIQGSGMVVQEDNTSAIKVSSDMGNVLVYPNPTTTGDVNIAFEKPMEGQLNLEVTNLLGQQVYQETLDFSGVTHKLNLNKIAKGMFQMTIRINGMEQTTRIVRD